MLYHVYVGEDFLAEQLYLFPLAEVQVAAVHELVLPFVQAGAELVIKRLERKALSGQHPADKSHPCSIVERMDNILGDISGIQDTLDSLIYNCIFALVNIIP